MSGSGASWDRELFWTATGWPGCEHLQVRAGAEGVMADGMVLAMLDGAPVRLEYEISCDVTWRTRRLRVRLHRGPQITLIAGDGDRWYDGDGPERPDLAGCVDVDIALTPFTNTLPIRRLRLQPGASADLRVVYVQPAPDLTVTATDQRYVRLNGRKYRYASGSFVADLTVDADGIVSDYPGLWTLVTPGP